DFGNPRGRITAALDDFIDLERSLLKQVEYRLQLSAQVLWKRALRRAPRFTATHHQLGRDFFHNIVYRLYQFPPRANYPTPPAAAPRANSPRAAKTSPPLPQTHPRRNQRSALLRRFHHYDPQRQTADQSIARGKIERQRPCADWKFRNHSAIVND